MSFGGRFLTTIFDFEDRLKELKKFKKPYQETVVHFNQKVVLKDLKKIRKLLDETIKEIERQAVHKK